MDDRDSNGYGPHCADCPLYQKSEPQVGTGDEQHARFVVVTGSPSNHENSFGRLMRPEAMKIFRQAAEAQGFGKEDFWFYPAVRCPHDPERFTAPERRAITKACRHYYEDEVAYFQPEVILPLGAEAASQVFGHTVQITKVRGIPTTLGTATVLPTLNPQQCALHPQHTPTLHSDLATLGRLVDHDYDVQVATESVMGEYTFIDDLQFLIDADPDIIAFDTENTGLRWFQAGDDVRTYPQYRQRYADYVAAREAYRPDPLIAPPQPPAPFEPRAQILTMQFSIEPGKAYMLAWDHPDAPRSQRAKARLKRQLKALLCKPGRQVIGQNLKYDCVYLYAQTGIRFKIGGDTLMLAALIDENATTKNLDDLVKRFVPDMAGYADRFNSTVNKARMWEQPLNTDFLNYGCGDADASIRLHAELMTALREDAKLLNHYRCVSLPGLNAFASMELRGMVIDETQIAQFEEFMADEVERERVELLKAVPREIKQEYLAEAQAIEDKKRKPQPIDAKEVLKFSKKDFVLDILFRHPKGFRLKPRVFTPATRKLEPERRVPSTSSKDHLPYFFEECPFTAELAHYIKDERLLGTNVRGFHKKYVWDGMVRPTYSLARTVTGRSASEDPNGQNFPSRGPRAEAYRRMFAAPPGHVIIANDLSQAELRIAAAMSGDPTMIEIYRTGGDIHTMTALIVMGVTLAEFMRLPDAVRKDARKKAKAVNFGFLYGMGWRRFVAYAKTDYGVTFTEKEAQRIRKGFFDKYSRLPRWHAAMREFAQTHGFVRSFSGRIRHLPMIDSSEDYVRAEAERQAINSPVQEFGSSLGVMALGRLNEEIDPQYLSIVGFVHDAIIAYAPEEYALWGAATLKWYMESNPLQRWFGLDLPVPIVADASLGYNLGEMAELGEVPGIHADGRIELLYDTDQLWNAEKQKGILLPEQHLPPRNGRTTQSIYTFCEAA